MHEPDDGVDGVVHLVLAVAQELPVAWREVDLLRGDVPVPETVVAAGHGELEALLGGAQGVLEGDGVGQHPARQEHADRDEDRRDREREQQQDLLRVAGRLAERVREVVLEGRQRVVDLVDPVEEGLERLDLARARDDVLVHRVGDLHEFLDEGVALRPDLHDALDVVDVAEGAEQTDRAADVVGVSAGLEEALGDDLGVHVGLAHLDAGDAHAERDRDGRPVVLEVLRLAGLGVAQEVEDGVLLGLGPDALAFDVRAAAREDVEAGRRDHEQQRDDREERPDDEQQPAGAGDVETAMRRTAAASRTQSDRVEDVGILSRIAHHAGGGGCCRAVAADSPVPRRSIRQRSIGAGGRITTVARRDGRGRDAPRPRTPGGGDWTTIWTSTN